MNIFYYCFGSAHSSVTAANIHLGHLPKDRRPTWEEILSQPLFDRTAHGDIGLPLFMGNDEWANGVYCIGFGRGRRELAAALPQFVTAAGGDSTQVVFVDALAAAVFPMHMGGFMSRRLGLVSLGRFLLAIGIRRNWHRFVEVVERTRSTLTGQAH